MSNVHRGDVGRPQPAFLELAERGLLRGRLLDAGCGTGEHTLLEASVGADVLGIDVAPTAIEQARRSAEARGLAVAFEVADALALEQRDEFDTVIDSGLFHVFDDDAHARYVAGLGAAVRSDGRCYLMCFSDLEPGDWGPRRIRPADIRAVFEPEWHVEAIDPNTFELVHRAGSTTAQAWRATVRRR